MAIDVESLTHEGTIDSAPQRNPHHIVWNGLKLLLEPLASLRLTVVLFAMSIFLILAGTFAQVDKDIWEVISQYFRCWFAWVPFAVFFPPSFVPETSPDVNEVSAIGGMCIFIMQSLKRLAQNCGGFYFPGGKLIGLLLAVNLLSAHIIRFKAQARGFRLLAGLGALAAGSAITWFIIASAGNSKSFQTEPWIPYGTLWIGYLGALGLLTLGSFYLATNISIAAHRSQAVSQRFFGRLMFAVAIQLAALLGWLLFSSAHPGDSSMRILWQLTQGSFAASALLVGCTIVFGKRAGIVLLHSGIGLMMFYELHVALTAIETQMNLEEGETAAYVQDIRTFELAIIDKSQPGIDQVTAIPRSKINEKSSIDIAQLPFKIEVQRVLVNSRLRGASAQDNNPANAGLGVEWFAEEKRPGAGTDSESKVDMAAAYLTLIERESGKSLGTYLVGVQLSMASETDLVQSNGKTFELALRPKRYYKPYQFRLEDVRKEDYIGTSTPRSYASTVHIEDKSHNVNEEKTIWMNNPLRFSDETFYQSNYFRERGTGIEHTTLSVVANSGWMMPYVSCMLVGIGMATHFLMMLTRFLTRQDTGKPSQLAERMGIRAMSKPGVGITEELPSATADWPSAIAAASIVLVAGAYIAMRAMPPAPKDLTYDLYRFGQIPVVQDGRVKPLESAAYSALLTISGRTTVELADQGDEETKAKSLFGGWKSKAKIPAIQWMLDVIAEVPKADDYRVFRVENLEVQETIGVRKREGMRYSRNEIRAKEEEFGKQVKLARDQAEKDRHGLSIYQRKILELHEKLSTYENLKLAFGLHHRIHGDTQEEVIRSFQMAVEFEKMLSEQGQPVFAIAPLDKDHKWQTLAGAWFEDVMQHVRTKQPHNPAVVAWTKILSTYEDSLRDKSDSKDGEPPPQRPQDFNRSVNDYMKLLEESHPSDINLGKTRFEAFFNHFSPFAVADALYVFAFILGALGWLRWTHGFNRMAFSLLVLTLWLHTFALVGRIYISGRPPVTNLYSSAVFIGWGCATLGLVLEKMYRLGIGNLIASVAGFATLLIADGLSLKGDTFVVLQAVLDTQFWLATHVTTITLGYATTYLAGLLGIVYVVRGVFTRSLTPAIGKEVSRMIYGTVCFSIFFSFVGTVLGGLWADDSWGRFWGWDPKENGALIIVLWNALVLHARWGGMIKERGLAVLAIAGNIFVSWSWWGVNELGAGLHSYGFTEGTIIKLGLFVLSQLILIGIGLIPKHYWRSSRLTPTGALTFT